MHYPAAWPVSCQCQKASLQSPRRSLPAVRVLWQAADFLQQTVMSTKTDYNLISYAAPRGQTVMLNPVACYQSSVHATQCSHVAVHCWQVHGKGEAVAASGKQEQFPVAWLEQRPISWCSTSEVSTRRSETRRGTVQAGLNVIYLGLLLAVKSPLARFHPASGNSAPS